MTPKPNVKKHVNQAGLWFRFFDPFILDFFDNVELRADQSTSDLYKPWSERDWDDGFGCSTVWASDSDSDSDASTESSVFSYNIDDKAKCITQDEPNLAFAGPPGDPPQRSPTTKPPDMGVNDQQSAGASALNQPAPSTAPNFDPTTDEQPSILHSSAGKEDPASPAPSSSASVAWFKDPEKDKPSKSALKYENTVIIDRTVLKSFLQQYLDGEMEQPWYTDVIKSLARVCTEDLTAQLEEVRRKDPSADKNYEHWITRDDRMLAICQGLSDLCVYCDHCKEYPIFFGIVREINKIRDHARNHPHLKPENQKLMAKLLQAKAAEAPMLPGPLLDDNHESSLEEGLRLAIDGLESIQRILLKLTPLLAAARSVMREERREKGDRVQSERSN